MSQTHSNSTSNDALMREIDDLRARLAESERERTEALELIQSIQQGDVDAVVISGPAGDRVFSLQDAEYGYRALVEAMNEGAATLGADGTVLYCNERLSLVLGVPLEMIIGNPVSRHLSYETGQIFEALQNQAMSGESITTGVDLRTAQGRCVPVQVSIREMVAIEGAVCCMVVTDLTESKARDELIAAGQLATAILQSAAEAIAVCDEEGRVIAGNQALEELCGCNPLYQPLDGIVRFESVDSDETVSARGFVAEALAGNRFAGRRVRLRRNDGRVILLLVSASPMRSSTSLAGCVLTLTDITERERAVQALRESEGRLHALVTATSDAVYRMSPDWREMRNMVGREFLPGTDAASGAWVERYIPADDQAGVWAIIHEAIRAKSVFELEHRVVRVDGGIGWTFSRAVPLLDANGQIVEWFGVASDITARKQAEDALRESQAFLQSTIDALSSNICVLDQTGAIIAVNQAWKNFGEANREEERAESGRLYAPSGSDPEPINYLAVCQAALGADAEDAHKVAAGIRAILQGTVREFSLEYPCHTPEEKRWFLCRLSHFPGDGIPQVVVEHINITERKQAEEAMRASQAMLAAAMDSVADGVLITDAEGNFVHINEAFAQIYKFKSENECSKSFGEIASLLDVFTLSDEPMPAAMWVTRRALRGERATSFEYKIRRKDTGEGWIGSASFGPIRDTNGLIAGAVITTRDITVYKRNETRLRRFYETDLFAILYWTMDGGVVDANDEFLRMTGYSREDLGAGLLNWSQITPPEYWPLDEDARRQIGETGVHLPYEKEFVRKDGKRVWGLFSAVAYEDNRDEGISFILDITERKRAEKALVESEKILELFVEHAPAALAMLDSEMRYLSASRRWMADFHLGDRDLRGVSHYDVFPEIPDRWKEAHRRGLAGEVLSSDGDRFERADGSEQWVRWEIHPWRSAEGKVGGIVIFSEEITQRRKAEADRLRSETLAFQRQQLRALAARLQHAREEERKKVARDLHDQIGQILTAIKMDMAWAGRHLRHDQQELQDRISRAIGLANDGVVSVRRICSGLRPGILDDLGLAAAIEWQANEFASRTGVRVNVSLPPVEWRLDGDQSTAIFRIFQECLTNVARHAEAKTVRASLCEEGDDLLLVVQDDGKGFRESEVARSLGVLGMKERAQACGGDVQVASLPGKGTTVTARVPLRAASVDGEEHAHLDSR